MSAPADATGARLALLIACCEYRDPALRQLRSPGRDVCDLEGVLGNPQIGGFDVQTLLNASSGDVQEGIEDFCADRNPDDQLLIYLSCHGVLDDFGRLYYAAANTRRLRLAATAVPAAWLNERLEDCRARRQVVVLDCCHSGAFARGSKGDPGLALRQRFEPHGRGRVVLTASRSTEYSFEGEEPSGDGVPSVFTRAIVDGLTTGDADRDRDGLITVSDLYHHLYESVRAAEPRQTPELWTYGAEGDLLIAHSVRGAVIEPASLPEDLRVTLESPRSRVRETGVTELAGLLDTAGPGLVLTARHALQQIADEDSPRVAAIARAALHASPGTAAEQVGRELAERARREEQARTEAQEKARQQAGGRAPREAESPEPRTRPEAAARQPGTDTPPPAAHRNTAGYDKHATAQATSRSPSRPSGQRRTAGGAKPPPPARPSAEIRRASQVTWPRRLISYWRFWLGLLLILAGWIPIIAGIPHHIGYSGSEAYKSDNLTQNITVGLLISILLGVLLLGSAVISAVGRGE
jgi:Caspase domain